MTLNLGQPGCSGCDVWETRILGGRPLFEVGNMCDPNLFREAQKFSVMGANLVNAMTVIREREASTQSEELLSTMVSASRSPDLVASNDEPCLSPHSGMALAAPFLELPS